MVNDLDYGSALLAIKIVETVCLLFRHSEICHNCMLCLATIHHNIDAHFDNEKL